MRTLFLAVAAIVLAACSSSTEPGKAGDPSLLISNHLNSSWVYVTWRDGAAIEGRDSVPPQTLSQCVRFTAQPDSAYWEITATENGGAGGATAPYFNPADRPAWKVDVTSRGTIGSPIVAAALAETPC